jgi:hypothetical protein
MKGALSAVRAGREAKMAERLEQKASLASFSHINSEMTELENVIKNLFCVFQRLISFRGDGDSQLSPKTSCLEASAQDEMAQIRSRS